MLTNSTLPYAIPTRFRGGCDTRRDAAYPAAERWTVVGRTVGVASEIGSKRAFRCDHCFNARRPSTCWLAGHPLDARRYGTRERWNLRPKRYTTITYNKRVHTTTTQRYAEQLGPWFLKEFLFPRYPGQASLTMTRKGRLICSLVNDYYNISRRPKSWPSPGLTGKVVGAVAYNFRSAAGSLGPLGWGFSSHACWPNSGRRRRSLRLPEFCADFWRIPSKIGVRRPQSVFPQSLNPLAETQLLSRNNFGTLFRAGQYPPGWPGRSGHPPRGLW